MICVHLHVSCIMYHVYIAMSDLHRVHAIDGALVRTLDVITISKASELLLPDFYVAGSFPKEMLRGYWPRFKMRFRKKKCLSSTVPDNNLHFWGATSPGIPLKELHFCSPRPIPGQSWPAVSQTLKVSGPPAPLKVWLLAS
jgi:hypothetical protein